MRGQLQVEALRLGRYFFRPYADFGLGFEWLTSSPIFSRDGAHAVLMLGFGFSIGGQLGLSSGWDAGWTPGLMYQTRGRVTRDQNTLDNGDSIGVPGAPGQWQALWLTLGLSTASPLR